MPIVGGVIAYDFLSLRLRKPARGNLSDEVTAGLMQVVRKTNPEKLRALAAKIDDMGDDGLKLLDDLSGDLGRNLDWSKFNEGLVESWKVVNNAGNVALRKNINALHYADELRNGAKLGTSTSMSYRDTFFEKFPELNRSDFVVHHAIERQVLTRFPGILSESEMHSLLNLRGIPKTINSDVHLSKIRVEWNKFYDDFPPGSLPPTKQQLMDKATEIDNLFGNIFNPPIR